MYTRKYKYKNSPKWLECVSQSLEQLMYLYGLHSIICFFQFSNCILLHSMNDNKVVGCFYFLVLSSFLWHYFLRLHIDYRFAVEIPRSSHNALRQMTVPLRNLFIHTENMNFMTRKDCFNGSQLAKLKK